MLYGKRPDECNYCWRIEDLPSAPFSDRVIKCNSKTLNRDIQEIFQAPLSRTRLPKQLEIGFNNNCQMKCSYCSSKFSTSWNEEIKKFGSYKAKSDSVIEVNESGRQEILNSFWSTLPDLKKNLEILRVTGGEPLLSSETLKLLETFYEVPAPNLQLSINSNLSVSEEILRKHLNVLVDLKKRKLVQNITFYTSIDAWSKKAEYIRFGLNHDKFWSNLDLIFKESSEINVRIMSTFNVLSISSFTDLLSQVRDFNLRDPFANQRVNPLYVDIHVLTEPRYQSVLVGRSYFVQEVENIFNMMVETANDGKLYGAGVTQLNSMKRILGLINSKISHEEEQNLKRDFYSFFSEHDKRRNTIFTDVFPEMTNFWNSCKNEFYKNATAE